MFRTDGDVLLLVRKTAHKNHRSSGFQEIDIRNLMEVDDVIVDLNEFGHG